MNRRWKWTFGCAAAFALGVGPAWAGDVTGQITLSGGAAAMNARVTLFTTDLSVFREARTNASGNYQLAGVPDGAYRLGVALRGREYQEVAVTVAGGDVARNFTLATESNAGRWSFVGDTAPEYLEGTGWGTLLPSGEIFYCHDSNDPVVFDTVSRTRWFPLESGIEQGCHLETLQTDGLLFIAGGSTEGLPQVNVVKTCKVFRRNENGWALRTDMNEGRWYPGGVRLPDERLLAIGGEAEPDGYGRLNTSEIYNPATNTWTMTGSFNLATEMPPSVLLLNGEVLKTWRYPEIYNLGTGLWRPAANMIQARIGAPTGDHCDHEIIYLADGRVMALGIDPAAGVSNPSMVEFYAPASNQWTKGPTPAQLRRAPEAALLPDGKVFCFGGVYTGTNPGSLTLKNAGQVPNCTNVADLFDPVTDAWRPMAPANRWSHYHSVTVLGPDGIVYSTGGAGTGTGLNFGDETRIEAFEPPYLFRGVRPRIDTLSTSDLSPSESFTMNVSRTNAVTQVLLLSARAASHWIDLGSQRILSAAFTQSGSQVTATVPSGTVTALPGWYLLFAMVDDIPSEARMVRITASTSPPAIAALNTVSVSTTDAAAAEAGANAATFQISRTGNTSVPLTVFYAMSGTATPGPDFGVPAGFAVIPEGASAVSVSVTPVDDSAVEGNETVILSLMPRVHYAIGAAGSATAALADNDTVPAADSDSDGLLDSWELLYFGNLNQNGSGDPDGDGRTNAEEFAAGTAPNDSDSDNDGLSDGQEAAAGTDPNDADSDNDGMNDGVEVGAGFNPLAGDQDGNGRMDGQDDWDGDGTPNQTDPTPGSVPLPAGGSSNGGSGGSCGATGAETLLVLLALSIRGRRRRTTA